MELFKVTMDSLPVWVSLPNLSFNLWNKETLSIIYNVLGKPLFSDTYTMTKERLSFARVCVEIDARKALKDYINVYLEDDTSFVQKVVYD